jgi:hypothetical protein
MEPPLPPLLLVLLVGGACVGIVEDRPGGAPGTGYGEPNDRLGPMAGGGTAGAGGPATGSGSIGAGPATSAPGSTPGASGCDPGAKPATPARLLRLTAAQWSNTVAALLGPPATAPAGPDRRTNPFDDGLASGRFSTDVTRVGLPVPSLTLLLDAAESLADELAPRLKAEQPCLATPTPDKACIQSAVAQFGARAFRRPLSAEEVTRYAGFLLTEQEAEGADGALRLMLAAFLASPHFAFRWEVGADASDAWGRSKLTPYETASALAYTLTDAPPDPLLLAAAAKNELATAEQVAAHIHRLLGPAGDVVPVRRFFQEYFHYPAAKGVSKDPKTFPFHRGDLLVEDSDLFIAHAVGQRKDFLELLLASPRGFARAETAASYGLAVPTQGPALVDLPPGQRAGILTHPSFLVAFSDAEHTHPIPRGKLVSDDLLCLTLAFPMEDIPPLPNSTSATVRERLAVHSSRPDCAACHRFLDPPAIALEQYDHAGRYRTMAEDGKTVDASGVLVGAGPEDGPFVGPVELMRKLARSPVVRSCFVRRTFRYFLGREEQAADGCVLESAQASYTGAQGDVLALFASLLTSEAFLYRTAQ